MGNGINVGMRADQSQRSVSESEERFRFSASLARRFHFTVNGAPLSRSAAHTTRSVVFDTSALLLPGTVPTNPSKTQLNPLSPRKTPQHPVKPSETQYNSNK